MVGFIQHSSDPSQPGRALDKKNSKITPFFLCLYYLYTHQIWRELWRKKWYLLLLKCFWWKSGSQKVWLTAGISTLTPPIMKNTSLQFSGWIRPFWSSLYFFLKQFFFWLDFGPRLTPASQQRWINPTIFLNFFLNLPLSIVANFN